MAGNGQKSCSAARLAAIVLMVVSISAACSVLHSQGLKVIDRQTADSLTLDMDYRVVSLGDFNRDGGGDLALLMPLDSTKVPHGGSLHLFWGAEGGIGPLDPANADLSIYGEEGFWLGQSVGTWDQQDTGWRRLVVGCPGAYDGSGTVLLFEPVLINDAPKGRELFRADASMQLNGTGTVGLGTAIASSEHTSDKYDDLLLLSSGDGTVPSKATVLLGGLQLDKEVTLDLGDSTVSNITATATMDLYGEGRDALVLSTPERGEVRIVYFSIVERRPSIAGANSTGIVDFQGTLASTGNTFGWGAGDDGWDTSAPNIYGGTTTVDSVRYNQATGNAITTDRSIGAVNMLQIEIGGVAGTSNDVPESGAYGISFQVSADDLENVNSASLHFDYMYEDYGFENNERMWIKGRVTSPPGTTSWLGRSLDGNFDNTPEIWTMTGTNSGGSGIYLSGTGSYSSDLMGYMNGPGEYYLDIGGKVSRWTQAAEFGVVGFDNLTVLLRALSAEVDMMTGSGMLGSNMVSADVDSDGTEDLLLSSPQEGKVRVFRGGLPYWKAQPSLNQWMSNITLSGTGGTGFGSGLAVVGSSMFTPAKGLLVSEPQFPGDQRSGAVHLIELPLQSGDVTVSSATIEDLPSPGEYDFGTGIFPGMDPDQDGFDSIIYTALNGAGRLVTIVLERAPTAPSIRFQNPRWHQKVSGYTEIRIEVVDPDGDADPWDVKLYKASDNNTWFFFGSGSPDRVEGNVAIKGWNTSEVNNGKHFLKATIEDGYGLTKTIYTDYVEVFNHAPPVIILVYPGDGLVLLGTETVSARVQVLSGEVLAYPVTFHYSRDNATFLKFEEFYEPTGGVGSDYLTELDTEELPDGPIWFRVNATTEYGLGRNVTNIAPCTIDNSYAPQINLTYSPVGPIFGVQNVTVKASDRDGDLVEPVKLFIRKPGYPAWDLLANLSGPYGSGNYYHHWDTTEVDNGEYELKASVSDSTSLYVEDILDATVTVHNLYPPSVAFVGLKSGDIVKGIVRLRATITDRDMNILDKDVRFYYRKDGLDTWSTAGQTVYSKGTAFTDWETTNIDLVPNGMYDLRIDVKDLDNQSASSVVENVRVMNPYFPKVFLNFPSNQIPLKGTVRLLFNVSDDASVRIEDMKVEVFVFDHWEVLPEVMKERAGGSFTPWNEEVYYVDWDTTEKKEDGEPLFPDGPGYDVRITVMDQDGLNTTVRTPVSFDVMNGEEATDDDDGGSDLSLPPWVLAILGGLTILLVLVLLLGLVLFRREKEEEAPPFVPPVQPPVEMPPAAPQEPARDRMDAIYSPPGWDRAAEQPAPVPEDIPMFTTDAETPVIPDEAAGREVKEPRVAPVPPTSGPGKGPPRRPSKREAEPVIDLPEGVMPESAERKRPHPKKARKKEPEPEVEDWDAQDEMEDFEEMEEDDIMIECKCGQEFVLPSTATKFICPSCGRTGKLRK